MENSAQITAVGREDFILPFGAVGFDFKEVSDISTALRYILQQNLSTHLFIIEEDLVIDIEKIEGLEEKGANILILKSWGKSKLSERKIRSATVKAIGTDI